MRTTILITRGHAQRIMGVLLEASAEFARASDAYTTSEETESCRKKAANAMALARYLSGLLSIGGV